MLSFVVSVTLFVTGVSLVLDSIPSLVGLQERLGLGGFQLWLLVFAARLVARRVAFERGERVGETVEYSVRFEDVNRQVEGEELAKAG